MTIGIIQKVFSPYLSTVTMHPMTYEDLERLQQELIEEIKKDFKENSYFPHHDCWCAHEPFHRLDFQERLIGDSQ